jgi:predicted amidophosphoribosyltransferase
MIPAELTGDRWLREVIEIVGDLFDRAEGDGLCDRCAAPLADDGECWACRREGL